MDLGLKGRACVVTGASRGIGPAFYMNGAAWSVDGGTVQVII